MDSEGNESGRNWDAEWVPIPVATKLEDKHGAAWWAQSGYRGGRHPHPH